MWRTPSCTAASSPVALTTSSCNPRSRRVGGIRSAVLGERVDPLGHPRPVVVSIAAAAALATGAQFVLFTHFGEELTANERLRMRGLFLITLILLLHCLVDLCH